ncbi:hypothetical protein A6U85_03755 [Agrobacterium sp. 13-626]|nr:hypothetical protein A6U85_03755 [Agrobacterium sp. 13-626]
MSLVDLVTAKKAIRVLYTDDDELIQAYLDGAEDYLERIGVKIADPISPAAKLAVLLLVGNSYQYREAVADGNFKELPLSLQMYIRSLAPPSL